MESVSYFLTNSYKYCFTGKSEMNIFNLFSYQEREVTDLNIFFYSEPGYKFSKSDHCLKWKFWHNQVSLKPKGVALTFYKVGFCGKF